MAKPLEVNTGNFESEVLQSSTPVLVDFWAAWCQPCLRLAPTIEELAQDYEGKVKVAKVDVDSNPSLAQEFNIRGIPSLIIFKDGKMFDMLVGAVPKAQIASKLDTAL